MIKVNKTREHYDCTITKKMERFLVYNTRDKNIAEFIVTKNDSFNNTMQILEHVQQFLKGKLRHLPVPCPYQVSEFEFDFCLTTEEFEEFQRIIGQVEKSLVQINYYNGFVYVPDPHKNCTSHFIFYI